MDIKDIDFDISILLEDNTHNLLYNSIKIAKIVIDKHTELPQHVYIMKGGHLINGKNIKKINKSINYMQRNNISPYYIIFKSGTVLQTLDRDFLIFYERQKKLDDIIDII